MNGLGARWLGWALVGLGFLTTAGQGQTLVWFEEFDGPAIDTQTWTYNVGGGGFGNGELQYHTARPENARIENGSLVIEARREPYLGKEFSSSRLTTHGRMAFKYGTLLARVKVPDLENGLWPALWLLGNNIGQVNWPACGEIDILEMGTHDAIVAGVVNRRVNAAAHWDFNGSYALYGLHSDRPADLNDDYHLFWITWTPTELRAYVDGFNYWTMDISGGAASSLEEFHEPFFIIVNLSVGGYNFVQITDPNLITAPFPAKMYVDYIRLYDNGDTELQLAEDTQETGNFGVFTETTPVNGAVDYGANASLYLWNNLTATGGAPFEGSEAWSFSAGAGNWFGMGVFSHIDRNMQNYSDGYLRLHLQTTWTGPFRIGVASSAAGEGWVTVTESGETFGLVRDGAWHEMAIPLNRFSNVDFHTIKQLFMLAADSPATAVNFSIDNIYWSPSVPRPTPQHGNYGIFTETAAHQTAGAFQLGVEGEFYIWENTLQPAAGSPYEGTTSMSLTSTPGLNWFGAAFTPIIKHNLTAFRYPESKLHFALKTSSNVTFQIGMRSGNVDDIGQKWIEFKAGNDPYGFVRDSAWHVLEIPMSDIASAVDLSQVSQLFELLGVNGPVSGIEFDDVCLLNGGAALGTQAPGDIDADGDVDLDDAVRFVDCLSGPEATTPPAGCSPEEFADSDFDTDGDVDLTDYAAFSMIFGG